MSFQKYVVETEKNKNIQTFTKKSFYSCMVVTALRGHINMIGSNHVLTKVLLVVIIHPTRSITTVVILILPLVTKDTLLRQRKRGDEWSIFNFVNVVKCPICLKTNLTKRSGRKNLGETIDHPYQSFLLMLFSQGK